MSESARKGQFLGHEISERQTTQLIGIAQGLIADNTLNDSEIHFLNKWLVANDAARSNPLISMLVKQLEEILADGVIDEEERQDLLATITGLTANDFELGEVAKSTTLPLCNPVPEVVVADSRFCFTGTFTFGRRKDCEEVTRSLGGVVGTLTQSTDYLVIGVYATESWKQESFGRKIEKAVEFREQGKSISIISETDWHKAIQD